MHGERAFPSLDSLSITAWEITAQGAPAEEQAALLIAQLFPGVGTGTPSAWALGRRNAALLTARTRLLGVEMQAVSACPLCGTAMELTVPVSQMLASAPPWEDVPENVTVEERGWQITLRLPTGDDLAYLSRRVAQTGAADDESAAWLLLQRCTLSAISPLEAGGDDVSAGDWPPELVAAASEALALADPLAEMLLQVECATCRHVWDANFDAAGFFLTELRAHGERMLDAVHQMALAYGWMEPEILALSPTRRAAYLSRIENG